MAGELSPLDTILQSLSDSMAHKAVGTLKRISTYHVFAKWIIKYGLGRPMASTENDVYSCSYIFECPSQHRKRCYIRTVGVESDWFHGTVLQICQHFSVDVSQWKSKGCQQNYNANQQVVETGRRFFVQ